MSTSKRRMIVNSFLNVKLILAQGIREAACTHSISSEGLSTAICATDYNEGKFSQFYSVVPKNLPTTLQAIEFKVKYEKNYNGIFLHADSFQNYPQLRRIINRKSAQIFLTLAKSELKRNYTKMFASLYSLEYLDLSESALDDGYVVHLPPQLKHLFFDGNHYQKLDVHWATDLEELSAQNNSLSNIPKVAPVPSPPALKILRLNGNPLQDMTVVDIAQLCNLELLELNFPTSSLYVKQPGYCKCIMLKKWANETELKGLEKVECFNPVKKPSCSEEILEEAKRLRKHCPLLKKGEVSSTIIKAMKYTFMFILLGLLLAALILYIIRHFHLREYWAAHHLRMSQPTSIKMEEGEEEMNSERSEDSSIKG